MELIQKIEQGCKNLISLAAILFYGKTQLKIFKYFFDCYNNTRDTSVNCNQPNSEKQIMYHQTLTKTDHPVRMISIVALVEFHILILTINITFTNVVFSGNFNYEKKTIPPFNI